MLNSNGTIRKMLYFFTLFSLAIIIFYLGAYTNSKTSCMHHLHIDNSLVSSSITSLDHSNDTNEAYFSNNSNGIETSNQHPKFREFNDKHQHLHDNNEIYDKLSKKVKILCWVMTNPGNHRSKALHVQATWGKRCDKLLFVSEKEDPLLPIIKVDSGEGRDHLTAKTMLAFHEIYAKYLANYDWFLKADDDTYVIVENLKYFLSSEEPRQPIFFGQTFTPFVKQGYYSGGAGYILSKEALRRFGIDGKRKCSSDGGSEDVEMGKCMDTLGVKTGDSRDALGRTRFHCFNPGTHVHGGYPDWYRSYDKYGAKKGIDSISDYAISFHYMKPEEMYDMEFFIYHLRPYGIITGLQELNRHSPKKIEEPIMITVKLDSPPLTKSSNSPQMTSKILGNIMRRMTTPPIIIN